MGKYGCPEKNMIDILSYFPEEILSILLNKFGDSEVKSFYADSIFSWLHKRLEYDFSRYSDIPASIRDFLELHAFVNQISDAQFFTSKDKSIKARFTLSDDNVIETVYLPYRNRVALCLSSQVGCKFKCSFCYTGKMGFSRNLLVSEILSQAYQFIKRGEKITHIVFMGMGEPLDNYDNVIKSIQILNHPLGQMIGKRRITISTVGIIHNIERLMQDMPQVNLAISLHNPISEEREQIVPAEKKFPLKRLIPMLKRYYSHTRRQVTFEYVVIDGVNNLPRHASRLSKLCKGWDCKLNIIAYNEPEMSLKEFLRNKKIARDFAQLCLNKGVRNVTIRLSKGWDVSGACGLLAGKTQQGKVLR